MNENKSYYKVEGGTERNFGLVFAVVFLIISLYPILKGNEVRLWSLTICIIFFLLSIFLPKTLIQPNKLWFKFGIFLGGIVSPLVMAIIFFLTVTPTGIIMKLFGKDFLNTKNNKLKKTCWNKKINSISSMKNQF